jgi:NAD+ synthase (glutamine-hydrolysing)
MNKKTSKNLRICLAQINPLVGDLDGNAKKLIDYTKKALKLKADIIVFPELALSGYPPEDLLLKPHFITKNKEKLRQIVKASGPILSIVGFPHMENRKLFNAAALIYDKKLLSIYKKIFLPNYGVFDEKRYFTPGGECHIVAFGKEIKVGINICEDIWYTQGPQQVEALLAGARVIINISASPYHFQKIETRERLLKERARENNAFILYCNLIGGQDELVFDGGSLAFDNKGKLIARGKQFEEDLITVDLNITHFEKPTIKPKKVTFSLPKAWIKTNVLPKIQDKELLPTSNRIEEKLSELDEIYSALILGTRDYVRKNNFKKVVIGLSGGIDSALTVALAVDALGKENVISLMMPSIYSSSETKKDARKIAKNLGIKLINVPINEIYEKYLSLLKIHFKGHKTDVAEQNIQARIRGNLLMAFSNKFGWLVLTTGNKSEISTGYCTIYGDMVGGFAVLKDVPKTIVYKLAKHRNKTCKKEIIPESILKRAPSAELKKGQKDRDTLPPYPLLDKILDLYIEKDASFEEIIKKGIDIKVAKKVISMVDGNEYKRRQAPPGIKITPKAFGKDRRVPITNRFSG